TGHTEFTVIPYFPHSAAAVRVMARMASFAAEYAEYVGTPLSAAFDPNVTTRPRSCARITGNAACISQTVPLTEASNGTSRSASVISSTGTGGFDVTALATIPSTVPNSDTAASTSAKLATRSPASAVRATYAAPRSSSSDDNVASPSSPRADTTMRAPRPARY